MFTASALAAACLRSQFWRLATIKSSALATIESSCARYDESSFETRSATGATLAVVLSEHDWRCRNTIGRAVRTTQRTRVHRRGVAHENPTRVVQARQ